MSLSSDAIDRIVANVLSQLSTPGPAAPASTIVAQRPAVSEATHSPAALLEKVITAELMERVPAGSLVTIHERAIVTPAAWDLVRSRRLNIQRGAPRSSASADKESAPATPSPRQKSLLIVVRNTPAVNPLWESLAADWQREWQGCPDDAAKLATSEICRGSTPTVVILAEQTHRAACLANRNERVKAVAVHSGSDVKDVRRQLRANVWCINPQGKSFYELKNLIQQIQRGSP